MHNIREGHRDVVRSPASFIIEQVEIMNPVVAPLWVAGLFWLIFGRSRGQYAVLGCAFLSVLGTFIVLKGKDYYVTPAYPMLFAAGAVAFEQATDLRSRWMRSAYAATVLGGGLILLPLCCPILSPENFIKYRATLGVTLPESEHQNNGPLPQYFSDEFGWEDMAREVARVYQTLTPQEQARTAVFSNNWGDAAAVDFFGPKYGLPGAICKHDAYWYWGPGAGAVDNVIILHTDGSGDRPFFASVTAVGHVGTAYSRRDEHFTIYLGRGFKTSLQALWPRLRLLD
jgi:hypothetical protein